MFTVGFAVKMWSTSFDLVWCQGSTAFYCSIRPPFVGHRYFSLFIQFILSYPIFCFLLLPSLLLRFVIFSLSFYVRVHTTPVVFTQYLLFFFFYNSYITLLRSSTNCQGVIFVQIFGESRIHRTYLFWSSFHKLRAIVFSTYLLIP